MGAINLGNIVGLIKSELVPAKTYVIWAKILNPAFPDVVELFIYDANILDWIPITGSYIKISIVYSEFAAAATVNDILIYELRAGYKLEDVIVKHNDAVTGGSISAASMSVGTDVELDKYTFDELDLFAAPSGTGFIHNVVNVIENWDSDTPIHARMTVVDDDLDNVIDGVVEFYLKILKVKI
jgi:hypothetical protein